MATQAKKAMASAVQVFTWAWQTAKTLWEALKPVWNVFKTMWDVIKPIVGKLSAVWDWISGAFTAIYSNFIKPLWDAIQPIVSKINSALDWVDNLYDITIGRVEAVYDILFGKWEDTWRRITDTEEKFSRLVSVFSDDLSAKIDTNYDKLFSIAVGKVRDLKDEILHKIDEVYTVVRGELSDLYWSIRDITDPISDLAKASKDLLDLHFEKDGSVARDTVVTTSDTYGQEWWATVQSQEPTTIVKGEVDVTFRAELYGELDDFLSILDSDDKADWSEVFGDIDDWLGAMNIGTIPGVGMIPSFVKEIKSWFEPEIFETLPTTDEDWHKVFEEIREAQREKVVIRMPIESPESVIRMPITKE